MTQTMGTTVPVLPADVAKVNQRVRDELNLALPQEIEEIWQRAQDLMDEQGLHVGASSRVAQKERNLPIDLFPYAIAAEEWTHLQNGVGQRIRAWNSFLQDIYGSQEIFKAGVLPFELVYEDSRYQRACVNVPVMRNIFLNVMAVDLLRDQQGGWMVLDDHVANPTGAAYAIQIRRVLSQVCPEMMEGLAIAPIHPYPTQLLETLQFVAPNGASTARVVLLTPGIEDETFYDHSLLARQMGIPLVQVGDLTVLDGELYLKTITGLEKVDVVYRRMHTDWVDPVSFQSDARSGIAGLLSCVRRGTVSVANALGSGLVENRGLAVFLPKMVEFYLNERILLRPVPSRLCDDIDVREEVLENIANYVIKPTRMHHGEEAGWIGRAVDPAKLELIRQKLTQHGNHYVAQSVIDVSRHPSWTGTGLEQVPVTLRLFALQGSSLQISPCGLSFIRKLNSHDGTYHLREMGAKDTWVLSDVPVPTLAPAMGFHPANRRMRLSSRAADCLFWIGRYAERAEATVLILRVIQQLRLEGNIHQKTSSWNPLWEALATATGHPTSFFKRASFRNTMALAKYVLLEPTNLSSAMACLRSCRENAQQVREAISPEVWVALNSVYLELESVADDPNGELVQDQIESMTLHDTLLRQLNELTGCVEKHMLHNDAWHFWQIGRNLERGLFTLFTMRQVFLKLQDERAEGGGYSVDAVNLDALLRMLAGQYAYRSSYLSRPVAPQVAKLLLQDEDFTRSVAFCLQGVRHALRRCFGEQTGRSSAHLVHQCEHVLSELFLTDVRRYFTPESPAISEAIVAGPQARAQNFAEWLDSIAQRLLSLGTLMADYYVDQSSYVAGSS